MENNDVESTPNWPAMARTRWKKAPIIERSGPGPFAVVQRCDLLSISLCSSLEHAQSVAQEPCCGSGYCYRDHSMVELRLRVRRHGRTEQLNKADLRRYRRYGHM